MIVEDLSSVSESHLDSISVGDEDGALGGDMIAAPLLHGRAREKRKLFEEYHSVLQTQGSRVVFVHGTSGQGKTSLVDTLREPVISSNGYFCAGKFFQDSEIQEPYSAIMAAFSDLCDLVAQSPDFDDQERDRIQGGLDQDAHLLSRGINLAPFFLRESVHVSPDEKHIGTTPSFARFRAACKNFLLTMSTKEHPVVLFLDDIQWVNDGSERLIDMFMTDDDIKNVLFILSYRDEEVAAVTSLLQASRAERSSDIQLANLDFGGVRSMIAASFESSNEGIDQLSKLTLQRTGGNPFFVSLFLEVVGTEEFLAINGSRVTFDIDKIRGSIMVADSVVDLLSQKIHRLTDEVREILVVASLIGYIFDQKVLFEVPGISKVESATGVLREDVHSSLTHAVDVGFIEAIGGGRYQFTHDRLQTGFQDLVDKPTREDLHLHIGKMFLAQKSDGSIYNAAVHLNVAPGFLHCPEQAIKLAQINLAASRYCKSLSAFDRAVVLLHKGLELLDSIGLKWSSDLLDLCLELTESLARMTLLVGDFDTCFEAVKEALLHANTKERRMGILLIELECRMANNEMEASIDASKRALSELGVKLPRKVSMGHVVLKLMKLKLLMARKTENDILGLPVVNDVRRTVTIRLLMHIAFYALLMDEEALGVYAAFLAMDLTLKHGLSTYSAPALALFGIAVLRLGNIEWAYKLGKLALQVMKRNTCRDADSPTIGFVNVVLLHWKESLQDLCGPLAEAAASGIDRGDLIYSTYCISQVNGITASMGSTHLGLLEESILAQFSRIHDVGQALLQTTTTSQDELLIWIRPNMQYVANLRSTSTDWHQLSQMTGDFMDFNKHSREANSAKNIIVTATTLIVKGQLENVFGLHGAARKTYKELESLGRVVRSTYGFNLICWGAAFANYECFRTSGKRKHFRKARMYKKHLERRDVLGPNASTYLRHLELKEALLRWETDSSASSLDDETLPLLDRRLEGFSLDGTTCTPCFAVAAAFVDAGSFAERIGYHSASERYFEQAKTIYYEEWGAIAPAAWVEEKCESLRRKKEQEITAFGTRNFLVGGIVQFSDDEAGDRDDGLSGCQRSDWELSDK